jgi:hypothetical protein
MQLESKQLADAQRRLADEARSGRGGVRGDDADASRRRTGEQERLAGRMERLEQSVRQMAGSQQGQGGQPGQQGQSSADARRGAPSGAPGQPGQEAQNGRRGGPSGPPEQSQRDALNDAARELDRQRLSERMRDTARAPRESQAQEGQQIARELDRLAERLGAANGQGGESNELSEQLSRIRDLREQLSQLERQLSELQREGQAGGRDGRQGGRDGQGGEQAQNGRAGQGPPRGNGDNAPWDGARELLEEMRRQEYETPTASQFNPGRSAPGTEGWKQDFAQWEELKVQLAAALERAETNTAAQLRAQQATDRLNAGAAQTVPEQYRRLVDQYYRALAQKEKR